MRNARTTRNHSNPYTRCPESHRTAYIRVVHGSRKNPSSGTNQLSNASLSRSLKIAMKNSASRAENSAMSASRQPMSGREDLCLLDRELVVGQDPLLLQVGEILELLDRVDRRCRGGGWGRCVLLRGRCVLLLWWRLLGLLPCPLALLAMPHAAGDAARGPGHDGRPGDTSK